MTASASTRAARGTLLSGIPLSREELRLAIVIGIERTYHSRRRQRGLGKLTPIEFETLHEVAHAA